MRRTPLPSTSLFFKGLPSGTVRPSEQDIQLTQRVQKAATLLGFRLNDHLIIGDDGAYFSFADEGLL
ncbi:JAB domain-containing protein [Porphyromonas gingivalis]|uniref:JAB domain-containing protein n=1 Tax=Porphyromonas gingivalis TaxID=837 RepID=UPI002013906F|nr:JAB domain-containing protein [Porphyromonas gingivalis]